MFLTPTELTNKSFENGISPQIMIIAKVIPLYKGKNVEQSTNYRQISFLPSISFFLETNRTQNTLSLLEHPKGIL
jgi:hypothetical protein